MTGTASEVYDTKTDVDSVNLFAKSSSRKSNAKCILHDISQYGCTILMPVSQLVPAGKIRVTIFSPNESGKVNVIVSAKIVWVDNNFSENYKRIRTSFIEMEEDLDGEINRLRPYLCHSSENKVRCNLSEL